MKAELTNRLRYNFINSVSAYIDRHRLIEYGDRVLVCVSGGADSVCLLDVLIHLRERYGMALSVCHVNHMLREEAASDQRFAEQLALAAEIPFYTISVDVAAVARSQGIGIEAAARQVRYQYFHELKEKLDIDKIATAHNKNDNAETVLMHLLRGSGVDGLKGMECRRGDGVIRPLLDTPRDVIEAYLEASGQGYVTDITNTRPVYFRNKIRLALLPLLTLEYNPNVVDTLSRTAKALSADAAYLSQTAETAAANIVFEDEEGIYVDIPSLTAQDIAIAVRVLRYAVERVSQCELSYDTLMRCYDLAMHGRTGAQVEIAGGVSVVREYGRMRVVQAAAEPEEFCIPLPLNVPVPALNGMVFYAELIDLDVYQSAPRKKEFVYFDYNLIKGKIYIRSRRSGDTFCPFGMKGTKKVKDFLIDEKVARSRRGDCVIVAAGQEILWIAGLRRSAAYMVGENTQSVLKISFTHKGKD